MLRQYIGDIGHLSVIISFITSIVAALAYYNATQAQKDSLQKGDSIKYFHPIYSWVLA